MKYNEFKKVSKEEMKQVKGGSSPIGGGCACTSDADCKEGYYCSTITLPCGEGGKETRACMRINE